VATERKRQFLLLLGTNAVAKVCWAIVLLMLLRTLGAERFGVLATLWSIATIAGGFVDLGTGQAILRDGSREHGVARPLVQRAAALQALLTLLLTALLAGMAWLILPDIGLPAWQRGIIVVLGIATPLIDRFQALFTVCSQIGDSYITYAGTRSAYFVLLLCAMAAVTSSDGGLLGLSLAYFGLTLLFVMLTAIGSWRVLPPRDEHATAPVMRDLFVQGLPFLLIGTLMLAYGRVEVTILGIFGNTAAAGSYHVIYQIVLLIYSIVGMFFTVVYPRLYRHRGDALALTEDFRDTVQWLALLAWMAAPPLWLFAEPLLELMGGAPLAAQAPVLRVLSAMILVIPASAALNLLLPADMLRARIACDLIGIAITVALATVAARHDQLTWVAAAAVLGYAAAIVAAQIALGRRMAGLTRILLVAFCRIGAGVLPGAWLAWAMPGNWWLRMLTFFFAAGAGVLLTHREVARRLAPRLTWLNM